MGKATATEQSEIVLITACLLSFFHCLRGGAGYSRYFNKRSFQSGTFDFFRGNPEDRLIKLILRQPDFELRRMYTDGNTSCTGIQVITSQCPLMKFIQFPVLIQCQRM